MSDPNEPKGKGEKKTAIELDALNQEIIKRDNKFYSLNKNFHLDLKTLKIIATKPNYVNEEQLNLEKRAEAIPEDIKNKIKDELFKRPNEKYQFPLTQSQEIGWDVCPNLNTGKRMSKKTCDVTRYADEYYSFKKVSPFATKSINKGEVTSIAK